MNQCRTCKWWGVDTYWDSKNLKQCDRWPKGYHIDALLVPDNELLVEDDEGWGAVTGPDFGCSLHEERENPDA